jgi:hypothetical protein
MLWHKAHGGLALAVLLVTARQGHTHLDWLTLPAGRRLLKVRPYRVGASAPPDFRDNRPATTR